MASNPEFRCRGVWLAAGYAILLLIIYLSVTSKPVKLNLGFPYQDKLFHALAYFVLMFWFAQLYHVRKQVFLIACLFIGVGVLMEYIQSMEPARYAEFADIIANTLGVVLAVLLATTPMRFLLQKFERLLF